MLVAAVLGLGWWGLHTPTKPATPPASVAAKKAEPIVLEAVKTERLPDFEAKTAAQVAELRRLLPAADRADTTATGRYLRMARRYWLAENAAAHLTSQARTGAVTAVFPGQVDLTLERITWFMRAKAYNQHLTAIMEERLNLMQQGLTLRRSSLQVFKSRYEAQMQLLDPQEEKVNQEATGLAEELRGHYQRKQPLRGNITEL
ncbi:hypothetical protein MUN84_05260 [Hymenobacter sp. 5516J-16]|uniref:hypothetical protein n=1 Tax=Hymenobacter sp. 5516J-16 TaxID=2932253 RepID=UPI001FD0F79D|nr:hypothetical protein [Hymenobacter sp. 5516J-16]UOQ78030.1 hypothetical protein MUN84_05260 [Hymenobacter sp. 5516J-16]